MDYYYIYLGFLLICELVDMLIDFFLNRSFKVIVFFNLKFWNIIKNILFYIKNELCKRKGELEVKICLEIGVIKFIKKECLVIINVIYLGWKIFEIIV